MKRLVLTMIAAVFTLSACVNTEVEPDGPRVFRITEEDVAMIQFRHLDAVNAVRAAKGLGLLELSPQLNAAAATHALDISLQGRPWNFGSDGSSPLDRVARTGYRGQALGENISETFENDFQTLQAWMENPETRAAILDPQAKFLGFSWFQEESGKIWWVQVLGS
jgi:uncharacterized protein YkwD